MFEELETINRRPEPFECYTAAELWTDAHTSKRMLEYHLDETTDFSSRSGSFIDRSVDWIAQRFQVGEGTRIADFGCGPGLYAIRLARRKAQVTGIDFSQRSLQYAREEAQREGLPIRYVYQNYLNYETDDRFDLILMIYCDFCALSPAQRRQMLRTYHSLLAPGGSILLDVYSLKAFDNRRETAAYGANLLDGFWSAAPYYGFLNTFKYEQHKLVLDKYTIIEADRTRTVYNWFQHFCPQSLAEEFRQCGLRATDFYSDVAGRPLDPEAESFAIVARK